MENGISNDLMFKALLRKYTKKASIPHPVYQTFTEDTPHGTHYRTHVWVDGVCFKSPHTFLNKKMAEHDAARHVLVDFLEKVKSDKPVGILEDTTFCKSIVKEYALKMNIRQKISLNMKLNSWKPTYTTKSAKGLIPMFISSLELNGATYVGQPAKNKKEAEKLVARSAILSILDSKSKATMSKVVESKFKFYISLKKIKDLSCFQALTTNVASDTVDPSEHSNALLSAVDTNNEANGVDGAAVAEIPQPSPLVPSVQAADVNQNELKVLTLEIDPPTELVVPCIEFVPPASEPAPAGKKKNRKKKKEELPQLPPHNVAMSDSGVLLSGVDDAAVAEIPQDTFLNNVISEHDAAGHVLVDFLEKVERDNPVGIFKYTTFCKNIMNDYAFKMKIMGQKMNLNMELNTWKPTYTTKSAESLIPMFYSSLELNDATYVGQPAKTKKEAENLAARSAILSILDSKSNTAMSEIIESKIKFYESSKKVNDLTSFQASTTKVVSGAVDTLEHSDGLLSVVDTNNKAHSVEFVPPASEPALASGKKRNCKRKRGQLHQPLLPVDTVAQSPVPVAKIDSGAHLSVTDKSNEAHAVVGSVVAEISQPTPLAITPTESVVPCVGFVPPTSEPALASGKKKNRKKKKGNLHQPLLPVGMTSQSPALVDMIDSGALLSVIDTSTEAHAVGGHVVAEISQPEVNQNGPLEYAVKSAAHAASESQPELKVLTSTIAPSKELEAPHIEFMPPASEQNSASGERKVQLHESPLSVGMVVQSPVPVAKIDSGAHLSVTDKSNEAHAVVGCVVAEISQPTPLVPSDQVSDVIQNGPMEYAVKPAAHTPTESVVPRIEFEPPASKPAPASGNKKNRKRKKAQLHQPLLPVGMVAQSPVSVDMIDSGANISVIDKSNEAHAVVGCAVAEISQPTPLVPSASKPALASRKKRHRKNKGKLHQPLLPVCMNSQSPAPVDMIDSGALLSIIDTNTEAHAVSGHVVTEISQPEVNQNGPLEYAVKSAAHTASEAQPELKVLTSAIAPAELEAPHIEFVPPTSGGRKGQLQQSPLPVGMVVQSPVPVAKIDSGAHLSVTDKSNEVHAVVGCVVAEISQPTPLVQSDQVSDVIQNGPMEYAVKPAAHTPTELVVPRIEFVPPASKPDPASGNKKNRKRKKVKLHQPLLPFGMVAQSNESHAVAGCVVAEISQPIPLVPSASEPELASGKKRNRKKKWKLHQPLLPVAVIDSGATLSVIDTSTEAHDVGGHVVAEISQTEVNKNGPLEYAVKSAAHAASEAQPELKVLTSATASGEREGQLQQSPLPVGMVAQSPASVDMIDSGAHISVIDKSNEAHAVVGCVVAEISQPTPLVPSASEPALTSGKKRNREKKGKLHQPLLPVAMIDSGETLSVIDMSTEAHVVGGHVVAEISQPEVNKNGPLEYAVKSAAHTASEAQPELKVLTSATASGERKGQPQQSPLPGAIISQIPPVTTIDSGALLSVVDNNNEAHSVNGTAVAQIPLNVNPNMCLESAVKQAPDPTSQDQSEFLQASTSAIASPTDMPPASEEALASGMKWQHQSLLPTAQGLAPVATIAQSSDPAYSVVAQ